MPLPPDIDQRIQNAKAKGFTDAQIQADIKRKYGTNYLITSPMESAPAVAKPSTGERIARGAGRFLGNEKFGEGLGIAAYNMTGDKKNLDKSLQGLQDVTDRLMARAQKLPADDPRRLAYLKMAQDNYARISGTNKDQAEQGPTQGQFLSGAANTAITLAGAGTLGGKTAAGTAMKAGRITRSVASQPLRAAVAQSAGHSGGLAASNTLGSGGDVPDAIRNAALAAAIGGAFTGALGLAGKAIRHGTSTVPHTVYKTSTQMKRGDNAMPLIQENITGNRAQLLTKGKAMNQGAFQAALADDAAGDLLDPKKALEFGPLKETLERAKRLGGAESEQSRKAVEQYIIGRGGKVSRADLMKLVTDIDSTTPPAAFQDRSTSIRSTVENAIADAYRNLTQGGQPKIAAQMDRAQASRQLINAVDGQLNAKQGVPGFIAGLIQRTALTPAIGTRVARAGYMAGAPARFLDQRLITEALRRALKAGVISGANSAVSQ